MDTDHTDTLADLIQDFIREVQVQKVLISRKIRTIGRHDYWHNRGHLLYPATTEDINEIDDF